MTVKDVINAVCEVSRTKVTYEEVMGKGRFPNILKVRWAVWYVLRKDFSWTFPRIAKTFDKDRSTVENGYARAQAELIAYPKGPFGNLVETARNASKGIFKAKKWTDKDTLYLCKMWQSTKTAHIARHLGFSEETIRERARRHRLTPKRENERPKQAEDAEFPKVFQIDFAQINQNFLAAYTSAAQRNGWKVWEYAA
jgi:transposase